MWTIALLFAILAAAGLVALDAIVVQQLPPAAPGSFWGVGTALMDGAALRDSGSWLVPSVLVFAGLLLLPLPATRGTGFPLLYVGAVHLLSSSAAEFAAPAIGRLRPIETASGGDLWLASGNSFPSPGTAFYAGLFLPLILLFPRAAPLWLAPPLFVAASEVMLDRHYLSDVGASLALASALAIALAFVADKGRG
jgi:membrane-associated phospholipid phosphatase